MYIYIFVHKYFTKCDRNEPNCGHNWYGDDIESSFENTWNYTANAVKSVNKSFRVGAPGTCGMDWYTTFPKWAVDNNVPLDFFSTHIYPGILH